MHFLESSRVFLYHPEGQGSRKTRLKNWFDEERFLHQKRIEQLIMVSFIHCKGLHVIVLLIICTQIKMAYMLILKNNSFRKEIKMYNPNSSIFSEAGDFMEEGRFTFKWGTFSRPLKRGEAALGSTNQQNVTEREHCVICIILIYFSWTDVIMKARGLKGALSNRIQAP